MKLKKCLFPFGILAVPLITLAASSIGFDYDVVGWDFLACYSSKSSFRTFHLADTSSSNTADYCATRCQGSVYFGVSGRNCYCASEVDYDDLQYQTEAQCSTPCPGDKSVLCGGSNGTRQLYPKEAASSYYSVYQVIPKPDDNVEGWTYSGCFSFSNDFSDFYAPKNAEDDQNSPHNCAVKCAGSKYFVTIDFTCMCSNVPLRSSIATPLLDERCTKVCPGDYLVACGGTVPELSGGGLRRRGAVGTNTGGSVYESGASTSSTTATSSTSTSTTSQTASTSQASAPQCISDGDCKPGFSCQNDRCTCFFDFDCNVGTCQDGFCTGGTSSTTSMGSSTSTVGTTGTTSTTSMSSTTSMASTTGLASITSPTSATSTTSTAITTSTTSETSTASTTSMTSSDTTSTAGTGTTSVTDTTSMSSTASTTSTTTTSSMTAAGTTSIGNTISTTSEASTISTTSATNTITTSGIITLSISTTSETSSTGTNDAASTTSETQTISSIDTIETTTTSASENMPSTTSASTDSMSSTESTDITTSTIDASSITETSITSSLLTTTSTSSTLQTTGTTIISFTITTGSVAITTGIESTSISDTTTSLSGSSTIDDSTSSASTINPETSSISSAFVTSTASTSSLATTSANNSVIESSQSSVTASESISDMGSMSSTTGSIVTGSTESLTESSSIIVSMTANSTQITASVMESTSGLLTSGSIESTTSTSVFTSPSVTASEAPSGSVTSTTSMASSLSTSEGVPKSTEVSSISSESATFSSETPAATNLPTISQYVFDGCRGSEAGYPGFGEIGRNDRMTPSLCISLANGRKYVGIVEDTCYASDSIDDTFVLGTGSCDILCPGDANYYCGGRLNLEQRDSHHDSKLLQRNAPSNVLLTIYRREGVPEPTITETVTVSGEPIPVTQTVETYIVTTITYTTVNTAKPGSLVITEYCTTLRFHHCPVCPESSLPSVEMTIVLSSCHSCGEQGESNVWLTVPVAVLASPTGAHESPPEMYATVGGAQPKESWAHGYGAFGIPTQAMSDETQDNSEKGDVAHLQGPLPQVSDTSRLSTVNTGFDEESSQSKAAGNGDDYQGLSTWNSSELTAESLYQSQPPVKSSGKSSGQSSAPSSDKSSKPGEEPHGSTNNSSNSEVNENKLDGGVDGDTHGSEDMLGVSESEDRIQSASPKSGGESSVGNQTEAGPHSGSPSEAPIVPSRSYRHMVDIKSTFTVGLISIALILAS